MDSSRFGLGFDHEGTYEYVIQNVYNIYKGYLVLYIIRVIIDMMNKRGQVANNIINLLVAIILVIAVLMPVTEDVIENQTFTGTTATITNLLPTLEAVAALVLVAGAILTR